MTKFTQKHDGEVEFLPGLDALTLKPGFSHYLVNTLQAPPPHTPILVGNSPCHYFQNKKELSVGQFDSLAYPPALIDSLITLPMNLKILTFS